MKVIITFFNSTKPVVIECDHIFMNPDFLYILDCNSEVVQTFELSKIYHMTVRSL